MACYINIEDRYRGAAIRERQMQHVWAATAAAVVSVGATAAGTAISMNASQRAAAQQAAAAKRYSQALGDIVVPQWNINKDIKDAERITGYNIKQLEKIYPGAKSQREVASRAIDDYMRGVIPQDVQQETMRNVAELAGAGFRPQAGPQAPGGFQAPQALLSRNLGLTSLNLQQAGMGLSMDWQKLAGAFIESPLQVSQARLGFEKAAADIQMGVASGQYGAQVNTIGANLAAQQSFASGIQSTGSALAGGISGIGTAVQLRDIARSAGSINYKGQEFGNVTGFGEKTYRPQVSESGGLFYSAQPRTTAAAARALTGAYG